MKDYYTSSAMIAEFSNEPRSYEEAIENNEQKQ